MNQPELFTSHMAKRMASGMMRLWKEKMCQQIDIFGEG